MHDRKMCFCVNNKAVFWYTLHNVFLFIPIHLKQILNAIIIVQANYGEITILKQLQVTQGNPLHTSSGKHTSG
jgi:hypothetical protein